MSGTKRRDDSTGSGRLIGGQAPMIPIAMALVGALVGFFLASLQTPSYQSHARLLVGPIAAQRPTLDASGLVTTTYADLLTSSVVIDSASAQLGRPILVDQVTALPNQQSRVILLVVESDDATVPRRAADALAVVLVARTDERLIPDDVSTDTGQVTILDPASEPVEGRDLTIVIVLASLLTAGVLGAMIARVIAARRTRRLGTVSSLTELDTPVLLIEPSMAGFAATKVWENVQRPDPDGMSYSVAFVPIHSDPDFGPIVVELVMDRIRQGRNVLIADADPDHPELARNVRSVAAPTTSKAPRKAERREGREVVPIAQHHDESTGGASLRFAPLFDTDEPGAASHAPHLVEQFLHRARFLRTMTSWLIENESSDNVLAVLTPPLGCSATTGLTISLVDRVVLLARDEPLARAKVERAINSLAAVGVMPAAVVVVAPGSTERAPGVPQVALAVATS